MLPSEFFLGVIIVSLFKIHLAFYVPFLFFQNSPLDQLATSILLSMIRYIRWFIILVLLFSWAFFLELLPLLLFSGLVALQTGTSSVLPLFSVGYSGSWIPVSSSSLVTSIQFLQLPSGWPWASECSGGMRWADTLWVYPDSGTWERLTV